MTNLERATYRVVHSLRRREAGEHDVDLDNLVIAFAQEWGLELHDFGKLRRLALAEQARLEARRGATA